MMPLRNKVVMVAMFGTAGLAATLSWQFVLRDLFSEPKFFGPTYLSLFVGGLAFSGAMVLAGVAVQRHRPEALAKPIHGLRVAAATLVLASAFPLGRAALLHTVLAAVPFMRPSSWVHGTDPPPTLMERAIEVGAIPLGSFLAGVATALTCACAFWVLGDVKPRRLVSCTLGLGCITAALFFSSARFDLWLGVGPVLGMLVGYWFCGAERRE